MIVQVALSLPLLVSGSLFVRTLGNLRELDTGFTQAKRVHCFGRPNAVSATRVSGRVIFMIASARELPPHRACARQVSR